MVLKTERLELSQFTVNDAPFFFELVNDPSWIQYIGDRDVRTLQDSIDYLDKKIIPSYQEYGFGFYIVRTAKEKVAIGMSGLIKRKGLVHVDIGYAFLPNYKGKGYAFEATKAVLQYGQKELKIDPIVAFTNSDNYKSINLLERLGLRYDKTIQWEDEEQPCKLFTT